MPNRSRSSKTRRSRRRNCAITSTGFWQIVREARNHGRRLRARLGRLPARASGGQHEDRRGHSEVRSHRRTKWRTWCWSSAARFPASMATAWCAARSCEKMFGPVLYEAFREDQAHLRSAGHFQSRQDRRCAADRPRTCASARATRRPNPTTWFDYSEYGGMGGAVEMCSGVGACRKKLSGHHVPVVHGDARRNAHHARPRQRAAAGDERPAGRSRPGR